MSEIYSSFFDEVVDRRGTDSLKYDFALERGKPQDVLPFWVADMDFRTAPGIIKAAAFGIYGYSDSKPDYFQALRKWQAEHFGLGIDESWVIKTPGVVFAPGMAVQAFTKPGEGIIIQPPVYYPFGQVIRDNGRRLVTNPLRLVNGHYEIDFADFRRKIRENNVRLFLLCSPHNPTGRVWTREELKRLGDICLENGVIVAADEIHEDIVYPEHRHTTLPTLGEAYANDCIVCTSPSKTFNLAGLQISNILIPNGKLRDKFKKAIDETGYSQVGLMGLIACKAAYTQGQEWYEALLSYLEGNVDFLRSYLQENIPSVKLIEPEGTFLSWLDFRGLGLSHDELENLMVNKARLWFDPGYVFGSEGEGFERINIGCPRSVLKKGLDNLKEAVG